jgi:ribonuclease-3
MSGILRIKKLFSAVVKRRGGLMKRESGSWDSLYNTISYHFKNDLLLEEAMTHRSFLNEEVECQISNERLEFLGDAVLGLVTTEELFLRFPDKSEGELTRAKSYIVSRERLFREARKIGLGKHLFLGGGEERSGGRLRKSILSDAYEAVLGAMYLDGGLDVVRAFINESLFRNVDRLLKKKFHNNYKSWLLEYVQGKDKSRPEYRVLGERGPDHKKEFTIEVHVGGEVFGIGRGRSKKQAEQEAACKALKRLGLYV